MLVFFCFLAIVCIINLILYFSNIRIEFEKIKIDTTKNPAISDYRINIYLAFLNKIKYLKISVYKEKIDKMKNLDFNRVKEKITKLKIFKNLKEKGWIKNTNTISKVLKNTHLKLEKLNLEADVGIEDIIILSYFVASIDIIISILLSRKVNRKSNYKEITENYKYKIIPKHTKKCYLKSFIKAEFSLKISNIVKTSCNLKKIKV